jgi:2-amino-4-hydroxy-6-hydroxymethyldihydropteridine diphosphokinase
LFLTQPVGVPCRRWFINGVAKVETALSTQKLFSLLQGIEKELGRTRPYPGAPRTIDLDLLFISGLIWLGQRLRIPHQEVWRRRFVLVPLAEIAADFQDPVTKLTVKELLASCSDKSDVRLAVGSADLLAILSGRESSCRHEVY